MSRSHLIISDVSFQYDNAPFPIFSESNLTIPPGFTALPGKNGSGKTALLHLIMGNFHPENAALLSRTPGFTVHRPPT